MEMFLNSAFSLEDCEIRPAMFYGDPHGISWDYIAKSYPEGERQGGFFATIISYHNLFKVKRHARQLLWKE